jgi:hypothetical protein
MAQSYTDPLGRPVEGNEFRAARERFPEHAFVVFHREKLPRRVEAHGALVVDDLRGAAPLALRSGELAFTYLPSDRGIELCEGCDAASTIVVLESEAFSDLVNEIHSVSGLAMASKLHFERGTLEDLHRWEPALRALYSGRPIWTPGEARCLVDERGRPLDLSRVFTLDDSDEEMRAFFDVAGFLHVRGVYDPEEIAALAAEVDRARDALEPGTGDCWWSVTESGQQVVTRMNYLDRISETIRRQCFEDRVQRLGRLVGPQMRVCDDRLDGPMAFIKNSHVERGLGDLQWHQDDGLGGHPVMCPMIQVGIQLDRANAENGQLWVLAGSHRYSKHPIAWGEEGDNPVVQIETEPGDCTVHFGDIYHTTPPPTGDHAGRRVLYFKFAEPKTFEMIPAGAHYNDVLFRAGAGGRVATRAETWAEEDTQERFQNVRFEDADGVAASE